MKNAAKSLMRDALACGYKLRVDYDQFNDVGYPTGTSWVQAYVATTDCDQGYLYLIGANENEWAFILHGNNDDELICDHVVGGFIDRWQVETDYGQESMSREFKQRESI
jgi:hypothetical protein